MVEDQHEYEARGDRFAGMARILIEHIAGEVKAAEEVEAEQEGGESRPSKEREFEEDYEHRINPLPNEGRSEGPIETDQEGRYVSRHRKVLEEQGRAGSILRARIRNRGILSRIANSISLPSGRTMAITGAALGLAGLAYLGYGQRDKLFGEEMEEVIFQENLEGFDVSLRQEDGRNTLVVSDGDITYRMIDSYNPIEDLMGINSDGTPVYGDVETFSAETRERGLYVDVRSGGRPALSKANRDNLLGLASEAYSAIVNGARRKYAADPFVEQITSGLRNVIEAFGESSSEGSENTQE